MTRQRHTVAEATLAHVRGEVDTILTERGQGRRVRDNLATQPNVAQALNETFQSPAIVQEVTSEVSAYAGAAASGGAEATSKAILDAVVSQLGHYPALTAVSAK